MSYRQWQVASGSECCLLQPHCGDPLSQLRQNLRAARDHGGRVDGGVRERGVGAVAAVCDRDDWQPGREALDAHAECVPGVSQPVAAMEEPNIRSQQGDRWACLVPKNAQMRSMPDGRRSAHEEDAAVGAHEASHMRDPVLHRHLWRSRASYSMQVVT